MTEIDIGRARAETPGCAEVNHLNNAGAGLMPQPVFDAMDRHLRQEMTIGAYEATADAADEIADFYAAIAALVGGQPDEIAFIENATRAWDMAFYGLDLKPGDRIVTGQAEYASNYLAFLQRARSTGIEVMVAPDDGHGQTDPQALADMIDDRVKLIAITHVPTNGGLVNPAAEIGRVARAHGVTYLLDACQSVGQMPIDVAAIGCDALTATGRKFLRGPRGTGFLWMRRDLIGQVHPPMIDLKSADWTGPDSYRLADTAQRFENWERNVAGQIALGTAARYAMDWGLEAIKARVQALAASMRSQLADLPGVAVHDRGAEKCALVTFTVEGMVADDVSKGLRARHINTSVTDLGSTYLDMSARGLDRMVRASVHYYNTEDEVAQLVEAVASL